MSTTRRTFVVCSGAALAATRIPAYAAAAVDDAGTLLTEMTEELLIDYPESATMLGIDTGNRAALKSRLTDRSAAGQQAIAERVARRHERLC